MMTAVTFTLGSSFLSWLSTAQRASPIMRVPRLTMVVGSAETVAFQTRPGKPSQEIFTAWPMRRRPTSGSSTKAAHLHLLEVGHLHQQLASVDVCPLMNRQKINGAGKGGFHIGTGDEILRGLDRRFRIGQISLGFFLIVAGKACAALLLQERANRLRRDSSR